MNGYDVDDELIREAFERRASRGDPAGLARSIAEATGRIPQSHPVIQRSPSSLRLLAVAAVVVTTAGLGLAIAGSQPMRPDPTVPRPSTLELHQTTQFIRPFTYAVNVESKLGVTSERDDRFSITARSPEAWGVVVVAASEARVHPCPSRNGGLSRVLIGGTPADMLADLQVVGGVAVDAIEPGIIDGRPSASTTVDAPRNACEHADLHVSTESLGSETMRFDVPSRLWVTEVDGLPIVIQVWATTGEGLEDALPEGAVLVDSLRFNGVSADPPPRGERVDFVRPFTYRSDTGEELAKMTRTRGTVTFSGNGDPETRAAEDAEWGITISTTRGAVLSACEGVSQEPLRERADEFLAGLERIGGVAMGSPSATTFDGRDALVARIDPARNRCDPSMYFVPGNGLADSSVQLGRPSRMTLTEVDGFTMVIQVWAGSETALDAALPMADDFLEDLHFTGVETSP